MNRYFSIALIIISSIVLFSCVSDGKKIDYQVLVVPDTYEGPIIIFYDQKEDKGRIEFKNGKYYFYVDTVGVFFTTKKLGDGYLKNLSPNFENISCGPMSIEEDCPDERFIVSGGTYGGSKTNLHKKNTVPLRYTTYRAGKAKTLKNGGWYVSDALALELYENHCCESR